ncbi:MAG: glycosyltransferase family 1 protein [Phycisphaerae bacterium]|nr:glycosyltransferase family 1 protein [Phycisphaerae bacterium]
MELIVDGIIYCLQAKGGISRVFSEILPRMCDIDDSISITLFTQGQCRQLLPSHRRIKHRAIPQVPAVSRLMRRLWIGRGEEKLWHSTYYSMPAGWKGRLVVTVHDMIHERFPDLYKGSNQDQLRADKKHCVQCADTVICVSEATRQELGHFYGLNLSSVYVVPNACSDIFKRLDNAELPATCKIEQPFLLYIGHRARYKNFDVLVKAYSRWPRRKEVALVLVGGKSFSESEQQLMEELAITGQVKLLRDINDEILCCLYNRALAFVYPSLYEGFGIPLLEAMSCGCPVVASCIPSTIEVTGDCPIYFDPMEEDDLLNALDIALSEGRNSKRVRTGLEKVKSYSWNKTAVQTLKVYRNIYA